MPSSVTVPSSIAVTPPPLLRRETSAMATVPAIPATVLPPAQAMAPAPTAPCPTAKTMEPPTDSAPTKPQKRPRATKSAVPEKASAEGAAVPAEVMQDDTKPPDSGQWLIVAKAVRMHLKSHETAMHCGSDALPALNAKLADMIKDAINRAQSNGRKTLKACDF